MREFTYCPVPVDNGECMKEPHPDSKFGVCASHWRQIAQDWTVKVVDDGDSQRTITGTLLRGRCSRCEHLVVASPNSDGPFMCETCGHDATNEVLASHMTVGQALRHKEDLAFGIVYYIQFGPRIKIGTTRNLDQRLDALPHDAMLAFELGGYRREQARHKQFAHLLVDGQREWFNEAPDLMVHIKQLAHGHRFIEVDAKAALRQAGRRYERAV